MNLFCANVQCPHPPLSPSDGRIEIKAALPENWSGIKNSCVRWKRNGEAAFHVDCWSAVLKMARSRGNRASSSRESSRSGTTSVMKWAEKLVIVNAAKTLEKFDSLENIKTAAQKAAELIRSAGHCIAFTGAGISTSAGLGDFRGKSGKWTEQDQSAMDNVIQAALQMDFPGTSALESPPEGPSSKERKRGIKEEQSEVVPKQEQSWSSADQEGTDAGSGDAVHSEPPEKRQKLDVKLEVKEEPSDVDGNNEEESEETVDYENLRPTYTHEALTLLMERGLLRYLISQNCDGLHLLSGISSDHISELHGNVFVEKCPRCEKRYSRHFYVMHDEASRHYEELEDYGETEVPKPKFAKQCDLCGLCHRTGRRCEEKGCKGYLEDTIINFRDHLEDTGLDRALEEAGKSDIILCLGTTLMVTPACDIVEEAKEKKPLIICNRQKTAKDRLAQVRVFGDCDFFMAEVLTHLLDKEDKQQWEEGRGQRMKKYNSERDNDKCQSNPRENSSDSTTKNKGNRNSKQ